MIGTDGRREFGSERAATLSQASIGAQSGTMQLPLCVESQELLSIFCLGGGHWFGFQHSGRGCGSHSPSLGCPGTRFWAFFGLVTATTTEHAQVLFKPALAFFRGVTTVTPNQPCTTLSDCVHAFTTHSTVCTYNS